MEVKMPLDKICPFYLIFYKTSNNTCIKSACEFWSREMTTCSITYVSQSLHNISVALRTLIDIVSTRLPEK